jgi:hypothetical protein
MRSYHFVSCKKDSPVAHQSVVGFWKVKLGYGQTYPQVGYAYLFRENGTVRVYFLYNNPDTFFAVKAEGTYSVNGNQFYTTHTYINKGNQHSSAGIINPNFTFTEGKWVYNQNPNIGGKFFLNK